MQIFFSLFLNLELSTTSSRPVFRSDTSVHMYMRSHRTSAKKRTTKISSKRLTSNSAKFCTSEDFVLYGNCRPSLS